MKKIALSVAALFLAAPINGTAQEPYTHDEGAIVKVTCEEGSGSATRVGKNTYISVDHVTRNTDCKVDGKTIEVTYFDRKRDLSTFIGPEGKKTIEISCDGYRQMEGYVARGYAFGRDELWFQPLVYVTTYFGFHVFAGEVYPGMSGGPILDKEGRITGTVNIRNPAGSVDLSTTPICRGHS
jgi:hypothetical protein